MGRHGFRLWASALLLWGAAPAAAGATDRGADWGVQIGAFGVVAPKYDGAKDYRVIGFPFIAPSFSEGSGSGTVQFKGVDDIRFRLIETNGFEAGPLAGWRFGRDDTDAFRLRGLGDVDGGLVVGGYAGYRLGPFFPFVAYQHQVTGDEAGGIIRFGIEHKSPIARWMTLTTTIGANWADDDYMDAYFSVNAAQSAASVAGLGVYNADAGIKDVFIGFAGDVPLSNAWTLKLSARYSRLLGDAADSPIIESENQFTGGIGVTYKFGAGRR